MADVLGKASPPRQGGFLAEHALKRALLTYHDALSQAPPESPWLQRFPIMVVLHEGETTATFTSDLNHFADLAPDTTAFYVTQDGGALVAHDFTGQPAKNAFPAARPVVLLRVGDSVAPCPLAGGQSESVSFVPTAGPKEVTVLNAGTFQPLPPTTRLTPESAYSQGVAAKQHFLAWVHDPSLGPSGLSDVVARSRESGVLVPATSYIVVEDSAQWKMLELKQRQKLRNHSALEFERVPEPTTALLLLAAATTLLTRRRRPC